MATTTPWEYPTPNASILQNVCNALAACPDFYVQTLNVMRSLNLPAPFSPNFNLPALYVVRNRTPGEIYSGQGRKSTKPDTLYDNDEDEDVPKSESDALDVVREKKLRLCKFSSMRSSTNQVAASSHDGMTNMYELFEINKQPSAAISIKLRTKDDEAEDRGRAKNENDATFVKAVDLVSDSELAEGRMSLADRHQFKLLHDYCEGTPSNRLYIKNVDKAITEEHLRRLFGRYVNWDHEEERKTFSVQLMTTGRMRGQAFVTFLNIEQASLAVSETNTFRFLFDDSYTKPLIVQYAKSSMQ